MFNFLNNAHTFSTSKQLPMGLCKYVNVMFLFVKLLLVLPETVYTLSRTKASIYPKRN